MLKHFKKRREEEKGFTLIELMVVVLIMGILMAIAIPTFLSTTNSAKDSAAESNVTNAITNEMSYYSSNSQFTDVGSTLDPSLPWADPTTAGVVSSTPAQGDISLDVGCTTTPGKASTLTTCATGDVATAVLIQGEASNGDCYSYFVDESGTSPYIGYDYYVTSSGGCPALSDVPDFATSPAKAGHAAENPGNATTNTWYTQW